MSHYFKSCTDNSLQSGYTKAALFPGRKTQYGSYNRFLDIQNDVQLFNPTDTRKSVTITVKRGTSTIKTKSYSLNAGQTRVVNLSNSQIFNTTADTYGTFTVGTSSKNQVIVHALRKRTINNAVNFVFPTGVQ